MNKTILLLERIEKLLESNPFAYKGYEIQDHVVLSPKQKEEILTAKNKIHGPKHFRFKNNKRRTITIYSHKGENFGKIEHKTESNHPMDINFYRLKKKQKK